MAKPIQATPKLDGQAAQAVSHELLHGTPVTPARRQFFQQAEQAFKRHQLAFTREGVISDR